jgi:8-oxo-dGTP diphosphatase
MPPADQGERSDPRRPPASLAARAQSLPTIRVGGFVVRDDKVLLVRQHRGADPAAPDYWLLPGGGLEFGETLGQALVREAREELGVAVVPIRPIALVESISPEPDYPKHVIHIVVAAHLSDLSGDQLVPRDQDVLEARFFAAPELDGLRLRPPFADDLRGFLHTLPEDVDYLGRMW